MKRISYIPLALFLLACACGKEEAGIDSSVILPPSNVVYDEVLSSPNSISIIWNTDAALDEGATAFTVQLVKDPASEDAFASRRIKSYEPRPCNTFCFTGLETWSRYFVRVRAEYETGVSEWVYLGNPTVVETGTGPVEGSVDYIFAPVLLQKEASSGSVAVEWSVTGFKHMEIDRSRDYKAAIYRDEACSGLEVSWSFPAADNLFQGVQAGLRYVPDYPAFMFTGLAPDTDYWVKVTDYTENELTSEPLKVHTDVFRAVVPGPAVSAGSYALYEDFEELIWGGGVTAGAAGYNSLMRSVAGSFSKAAGENPTDTPELFFVCAQDNEYEFFSLNSIMNSTRLSGWKASDAYSRACCLSVAKNGWVQTPALTGLTGPATVEIGFDARNYYVRESRELTISIINTGGAVRSTTKLTMDGGYFMNNYTVSVTGMLPGESIRITGAGRFILDNVYVKVLFY